MVLGQGRQVGTLQALPRNQNLELELELELPEACFPYRLKRNGYLSYLFKGGRRREWVLAQKLAGQDPAQRIINKVAFPLVVSNSQMKLNL